jgi:hypothetical protein
MQRRNTSQYVLQTWAAFVISLALCAGGVWNLSGNEPLTNAFFALAFVFSLASTLTLAKTVRDNQHDKVDTGAWVGQSWAAFALSVAFMFYGLYNAKLAGWQWGYMLATWAFMLSSAFTLAKTVRDEAEDRQVANGNPADDAVDPT